MSVSGRVNLQKPSTATQTLQLRPCMAIPRLYSSSWAKERKSIPMEMVKLLLIWLIVILKLGCIWFVAVFCWMFMLFLLHVVKNLWNGDLWSTFFRQVKFVFWGILLKGDDYLVSYVSCQHIAQSSTIWKYLQLHNSKEVVHLLQRHVDTYGWTGSYESPEVYGQSAYSQNVGMLRLDALSSAGWMEKNRAVGVP